MKDWKISKDFALSSVDSYKPLVGAYRFENGHMEIICAEPQRENLKVWYFYAGSRRSAETRWNLSETLSDKAMDGENLLTPDYLDHADSKAWAKSSKKNAWKCHGCDPITEKYIFKALRQDYVTGEFLPVNNWQFEIPAPVIDEAVVYFAEFVKKAAPTKSSTTPSHSLAKQRIADLLATLK